MMIKDIQDREANSGGSDFALGDRPPLLLPRLPCPWTYQCQGDQCQHIVDCGEEGGLDRIALESLHPKNGKFRTWC